MISPRSFVYANRHQRSHLPTSGSGSTTTTSPSLSSSSSPPSFFSFSFSSFSPSSSSSSLSSSSSFSSSTSTHNRRDSSDSSLSLSSHHHHHPSCKLDPAVSAPKTTTINTITPERWSPKYDRNQSELPVDIIPVRSTSDATMGKRKERRETSSLAPSSPPSTTTSLNTRPTTPTSPVKIPTYANRETAHPQKRHAVPRRRIKEKRNAESISPSLAALLAVTDIPRPRGNRGSARRRHRTDKPMTISDLIEERQVSEKDLSWSLSRSPLEMLLSPPEEVMDYDDNISDCNIGSAISTRTLSVDSIPSLGYSYSYSSDPISSLESPRSSSPSRRTRFSPMRKSLEPVITPAGDADEHPLAVGGLDVEDLDFRVFQAPEAEVQKSHIFKPLRSAFKSNLTASLRALRSAAKSFSVINFPSIPPDDFLTRSILTIDPNVPYTDERRPPVSEDIPSAAIRRYLNPTTNARIETQPTTVAAGTFAASIQMRTYKIQRSRSAHPSARSPYPATSLQASSAPPQQREPEPSQGPIQNGPAMRQREMRENPDFIRIAVMEMAMRKQGKLDDQRPGRARWALPPRKTTTRTYEIGSNGIPVRWIPITC